MKKLFVYGTLGPGQPNEHVLKKIGGSWEKGYVLGQLFEEGWGADMGYPGIRLDSGAEKVEGYVFRSEHLDEYWDQLDSFEGEAYQRIKTTITIEENGQETEAFIYVLK